jgi:hypothetical protein
MIRHGGLLARGAAMMWRLATTALLLALLAGALAGPAPVRAATVTTWYENPGTVSEFATHYPIAGRFVVPPGASWAIDRIEIGAEGTYATLGPYGTAIYGDASGLPGAAVADVGQQVFTRLGPAGTIARFRVDLATAIVLGPGTYWLGLAAFDTLWQETTSGVAARRWNDGPWTTQGIGVVFGLYHAGPDVTAAGDATYGDTTATLTATVARGAYLVPAGGTVNFTFNGQTYNAIRTV